MKSKRILVLLLLVVCLRTAPTFAQPGSPSALQAPIVRKVEPPNWWIQYTPDLTLLLTGENLNGARVETSTPGVSVVGADASANGHYLFVRLRLASDMHAGNVDLRISTASGSSVVQLPVRERADSRGRFDSFSLNDVIYLIMPDRFADGDPANDRPIAATPMPITAVIFAGFASILAIFRISASIRSGLRRFGRIRTPTITGTTPSISTRLTSVWERCRNIGSWSPMHTSSA
jgi:hypothetical protein